VSEDFDKVKTEADEAQQQEEADVEGHGFRPGVKPDAAAAATEEGPDVEAHTVRPKTTP
jgi:hypothetical protein